MKPNVFISWSGERSLYVANALKDWLPMVVQAAIPWMSESSIDKGARGMGELAAALESIQLGIVCLTPDNLDATWIHYESGALSKQVGIGTKTRLWTYLLCALKPGDIRPPLGEFQHTVATKEDTRKLIHSINRAVNAEPLADALVNGVFDSLWPQFEKVLNTIPEVDEPASPKRSVADMVAEILDHVRKDTTRKERFESLRRLAGTKPESPWWNWENLGEIRNAALATATLNKAVHRIAKLRKDGKEFDCAMLLVSDPFYADKKWIIDPNMPPPEGDGSYVLDFNGETREIQVRDGEWYFPDEK